jgi:hypothetical protein
VKRAGWLSALLLSAAALAHPAAARDEISRAPLALPSLPWVGNHHNVCHHRRHRAGWEDQVWQFRDPRNGILLKVAHDGRHLAAINPDGEVLWRHNPHAGVMPYRHEPACIHSIGPKLRRLTSPQIAGWSTWRRKLVTISPSDSERMILLEFDNSQSGLVDIRTGEFFFGSQN